MHPQIREIHLKNLFICRELLSNSIGFLKISMIDLYDNLDREDKNMPNHTAIVKKAYALLQLERRMVGIRFVYDKETFDSFDAREPQKPMYYCQAVHAASAGHGIKLTKATSGCAGSTRALGFTAPQPEYYEGSSGMRLGLYSSQSVAKSVALRLDIMNQPLYGIVVMPLEEFLSPPDTVMLFTNTREAMRVMQGYTAVYGLHDRICMSGNQAVCVECTTYPYLNQCLNLSMLCAGTRFRADWKDTEVAIGLPYGKLEGLVEGLQGTVNAIERNARKQQIENKLRTDGLFDMEIEYGHTYFLTEDHSPRE